MDDGTSCTVETGELRQEGRTEKVNVEAEFKPHHSTRRNVTESSTGANAGTLPKSDEIHSQRLHVERPEIRQEGRCGRLKKEAVACRNTPL